MKKIAGFIVLNVLLVLIHIMGYHVSYNYVEDDAKVLKEATIDAVNTNLSKVEQNTGVTIEFDIVKSLNGDDIDAYAKQYAKENITGEQYILFVSSIGDRKNKLLVGQKANSILSKSEIENIVALPNADFKASNFDAGIMKVGKALDGKVTTKAVVLGKAEVEKGNCFTTVIGKTDMVNVLGTMLAIIVINIVVSSIVKLILKLYRYIKTKFALKNHVDEYSGINKEETYRSSSSRVKRDYGSKRRSYTPHRTSTTVRKHYNNTTVVSDNSFVEGMVVGSILADSYNHPEEHHYREPEIETERTYSSNDWDSTPSVSSWDDDNEREYSSPSSDYTSGDWDSGSSDSDSSTSDWDSGSSDSDSSTSDWDSGSSDSDSSTSDWDSSSSDYTSGDWDSSSSDSDTSTSDW